LGKYDALFQGAPHKPSDIYRIAQIAVPSPDIQVVANSPIKVDVLVSPIYPRLARLARIEGKVSVKFKVDKDGGTTALEFENGHPMLRGAVGKAVGSWKFPKEAADQQVEATIEFKANCSAPQ
jgi:TonB family protein